MTTNLPAKRRRGGQPGNHNAKKNPGNISERRHRFASGNRLGGAPLANQNARRKRQKKHELVLADYRHLREASDWIKDHAAELDDAAFTADNERDRALFDGWRGLTPEALAEETRESFLSLAATRMMTRQEIFTAYANNVYLGRIENGPSPRSALLPAMWRCCPHHSSFSGHD